MDLSSLAPRKGARKNRRRVGRGNASGSGRTAGRGDKGLGQRSGGKTRPGFEGGQMPLYRRIPKFGFRSKKKLTGLNCFQLVPLDALESFADGTVVDEAALKAAGYKAGAKQRAGLKVVGGSLSKKLTVKVQAVSKSARAQIEKLGGQIEIVSSKNVN